MYNQLVPLTCIGGDVGRTAVSDKLASTCIRQLAACVNKTYFYLIRERFEI